MRSVSTPILLAFASVTAAACVESASAENKKPNEIGEKMPSPKTATVNVEVVPIELSKLTEFVTVTGETMAVARIVYSAETAGRVEFMAFDLGDAVKGGQVLARIDYQLLKAQADSAQASSDLAEKTLNRLEALREDKLVSPQQIDEAQSRKVQAEAQWRIAQANLNKSIVRATRSGIITQKAVEAGEFVGPGTPIYELTDLGTIEIQAQLPERSVTQVHTGDRAKVQIPALGREVDGKVTVVVPAAAHITKTFELRVAVANPNHEIFVGMAATVRIATETHENAVIAPHDVVVEDDKQRSVFIEVDGFVQKRAVILGAAADGNVILAEGVKVGERLVVLGQRQLVDGQPVRVVH